MSNTHSHLSISLSRHDEASNATSYTFVGCDTCMVEAIALLIEKDPEFKQIIKAAVSIANKRKQEKEN